MAVSRDAEKHDDDRHDESSKSHAFFEALQTKMKNKFGGKYVSLGATSLILYNTTDWSALIWFIHFPILSAHTEFMKVFDRILQNIDQEPNDTNKEAMSNDVEEALDWALILAVSEKAYVTVLIPLSMDNCNKV